MSTVRAIPPPLRAAARSIYRDLWRASTTTFSGKTVYFRLSSLVTHTRVMTWQVTHLYS